MWFSLPYGAPEHRKALGQRSEGGAGRRPAPAPRDTEVASGQRGPQSRGAQEQCAIRGGLSFGDFIFGRTKKSHLPWVSHPQLQF